MADSIKNNLPEFKVNGLSENDEIWVTEFTEASAQQFRDAVLHKTKHNPNEPIVVYIDSYGGIVDSLAKMIETMDEAPNAFITVCMGKAFSCGAILLSHGDMRFCGKHSRVMVHEISSGTEGNVHDMYADSMEAKRLNDKFMGLLSENCGIKGGYKKFKKLMKMQDGRNIYLSAQDSLRFGIVDHIGLPRVTTINIHNISVAPYKIINRKKQKTDSIINNNRRDDDGSKRKKSRSFGSK